MNRLLRALVVTTLSGCASISAERGHDEVARIVTERTGFSTGWEHGAPDDAALSGQVDALLGQKLTRRSAIAIALINNPRLQATYEELGISQADMVQAGLLKNPTFAGSIGFPIGQSGLEPELSLVQDIVDLFTMPWRKEAAANQFRADTLRVAQEALDTLAQVNRAFVELQATTESNALIRKTVDGAQASHDLSEKQYAAGNINDLALATERASFAQLQLELTQSEVKTAGAREQLNRLLGLWGKRTGWVVEEPLPEMAASDALPSHPESLAIRQRLDLEAARLQSDVLVQALDVARSTRLFGRVEVGVHYHQDPDGPRLFGPTLTLELPIFDQRQAFIGRLEAQERAAARRVTALAVEARSRVREGLMAITAARATAVQLTQTVVPLREQIVAQSQLHYNGMFIGLPQLMSARLASFDAQRSAIGARRDYWIARFDLESALGGALSGAKQ